MFTSWLQFSYNTPSTVIGQIEWNTPGTYQWTVPPGVESISFAAVGAGSSGYVQYVTYNSLGYRGYGGHGGNYIFRNNVAVTPGQIIDIVVGSGGTNASSSTEITQNGGGESSVMGIKTGGQSGSMGYGPASGAKIGNNSGTGATPKAANTGNESGMGVNLKTGLAVPRTGTEGGIAGGGGQGSRVGSSSAKTKGGDGAVRIVWGAGRAFPFTQVDNVG